MVTYKYQIHRNTKKIYIFYTIGMYVMKVLKKVVELTSELERLAIAGCYFREGFTNNIRYAKTKERLPFLDEMSNNGDTYILGPEKSKILLIRSRYFFPPEKLSFEQTETPGVLHLLSDSRKESVIAGYEIHMSTSTMPENIKWSRFDLKKFNKLGEPLYYRTRRNNIS